MNSHGKSRPNSRKNPKFFSFVSVEQIYVANFVSIGKHFDVDVVDNWRENLWLKLS